jgi:hypothetical protein
MNSRMHKGKISMCGLLIFEVRLCIGHRFKLCHGNLSVRARRNGVLEYWIKTRACGVRYYKCAWKRLGIFKYRIADCKKIPDGTGIQGRRRRMNPGETPSARVVPFSQAQAGRPCGRNAHWLRWWAMQDSPRYILPGPAPRWPGS